MRSKIILLVILISVAGHYTSFAQEVNDLFLQKLNGKVKSLTEVSYKVKRVHEKQEQSFYGKSSATYNLQGNKTIEYAYNPDGTLDSKSVFTYDNNGQLIQEDSYNPDGSTGFTNVYKYDKNGNMVSVNLYDAGGSLFLETLSEYDGNGNELTETNYSQEDQHDKHKDKNKDVILNKTIWRYDSKNNPLEEQYYEGDTTLTRKTAFTYDNDNNKTGQDKSEGGMRIKTTYKYDQKRNPVEETQYDASGSLVLKIVTTYDDKGNDIAENYYDKDNNLLTKSTFQISYDKNNNWIRKVQSDNDRIVMITTREIIYYQ